MRAEREFTNIIVFIDDYLNGFYHEILKEKIDKFIEENSYYGYKDKYIQESSTYQSVKSIISIQKEMRLYQGEMESEEIRRKYDNKVWDSDLINTLNKDNFDEILGEYTDATDVYLDYEDANAIYATYILDLSEKLLNSLSKFQSFREEDSHWGGNYLNYAKKYQHGSEILKYLKTGDKENLQPLIYSCLNHDDIWAGQQYFIKKHPDSYLAQEERKLNKMKNSTLNKKF
ncbi:MAG: hypothetical protein ACI4WE_04860 [Streptococcus gallolyticus]